jgi:RNA polymerase sigma factor (TIGR02999 family)
MHEITRVLDALARGELRATNELLPLVYDELRRLAAQKLAGEKACHTLQPTALVHEVYLRLVGDGAEPHWQTRGHFFAAAAEAMRRILVENARRKKRLKHGGAHHQVELQEADLAIGPPPDRLLAIDEALDRLAQEDAKASELVKLHFYGGLALEDAAQVLDISRATAYRQWAYARAWLRCALADEPA